MTQGQTIVIKGEITASEDLIIAGRVEGEINLGGRTLTLATGSSVKGNIEAGTLLISGEVEGSMAATKKLEIRETAKVDGDLTAPCLVIADGADVNVVVDMPVLDRRAVA